MNERQTYTLIGAGALALAGFVVGWPRMSDDQRSLTIDLVNIGLVGTLAAIPVGLALVPRAPTWVTAVALTALGIGLKVLLLPHGPSPTETPSSERLALIYDV